MKSIHLFIFLFSLSSLFSQDFEGVIEYEASYESKIPSMSSEEIGASMGRHATTYVKNGYYKELTNSQFMSIQLYRHDKKSIYYKHHPLDDTLRVASIKDKNPGPFEYEVIPKCDTILGVVCDKLIVKDKYGSKIYFYSDEYSLNPRYYRKFTSSNKNKVQKIMGAMYLRAIIENEYFRGDIIATKIDRKELPEGTFDLPPHKVLKQE